MHINPSLRGEPLVHVPRVRAVEPSATTSASQAVGSSPSKITGRKGGIGEAVLSALAQASAVPAKSQLIAVREMPHSGRPDELLDAFGISERHIVEAVRAISAP